MRGKGKMTYSVYITKTQTGETREHKCDFEWNDSSYFMWTEGNFSCDCNLSIFFYENTDDDPDQKCGNIDFKIEKIVLQNGHEVLKK